jgi:HD superfamily phosphohydrolase/DNA modification methylase
MMIEFTDILYGKIALPDWITPFLRLPEFVRLRGVRLSNIDSYQYKDFNGPTRWEHGVAVAWLAARCAQKRGLSERDKVHLILAGLLHDVATPPFAHTAESVLENFDHELESQRVLSAKTDNEGEQNFPVFASQLPQFSRTCRALSRKLKVDIDPDEVARMVVGDGSLGYLISGSLDLDNADNVTRACLHLGIGIENDVPLLIADWLATQDHPPTNLHEASEPAVSKWIWYRTELYSLFFNSSDEELGREAFLQHLMRRAVYSGLPRESLIWKTDESLLTTIEQIDDLRINPAYPTLQEMIQRYRLLEPPYKIAHVELSSEQVVKTLKYPQATAWIEKVISSSSLEPFAFVSVRRYSSKSASSQLHMFPPSQGSLSIFKLGKSLKVEQLPEWLKEELPKHVTGKELPKMITNVLRRKIPTWTNDKPWLNLTPDRKNSILSNLNSVGNWGFRLSKNESMHPYPSTFVHAIPATLINCLGLRGELIIDPFGGTGQTAVEAIKLGGTAISSDSNFIATLAAQAKLTYLAPAERRVLRKLSELDLVKCDPCDRPDFYLIDKWFHPKTLDELRRIQNFIRSLTSQSLSQFLLACFSAIIPLCTGRKGEQHGYFADNAPLSIGQTSPPYHNALQQFLDRIAKNINVLEQFYVSIERDGREPEKELARAKVLKLDARIAGPSDYGVEANSVSAIITSPPYLCMSDYTLGQRLSYYWLASNELENDFKMEIGSRRSRFSPQKAIAAYYLGLRQFAGKAATLLRRNGFLATVLGAPVAKAFNSMNVIDEVDAIWKEEGFELTWSQWRPISWHRNHGYQRLRQERVAVHVLR